MFSNTYYYLNSSEFGLKADIIKQNKKSYDKDAEESFFLVFPIEKKYLVRFWGLNTCILKNILAVVDIAWIVHYWKCQH